MKVIRKRAAFAALLGGWSSAMLACATKPPPEAPERTGFVAQPCTGLELGSEPLNPADARVFVEVAELNARDLPQPIGRYLDKNVVKVRSSVNLVAFPGVPTSMPWGQCVDAVCASAARSITVTAKLPATAAEPLDLALRIDEAPPEGSEAAPRTLLDTTLRAINQEPAVLPAAPEVSDGSLVLTAYLLRRPDDLHRVMECKVRQGEREKEIR
jgi:hypothetical protein